MSKFELPHSHGEINIDSIKDELAYSTRFTATSNIFKQLSDPTRLQIFWVLCHHEECVINIAALLEMSSPAVSHHLRSLHECGLISSRRDGKEVYYKVPDTQACKLIHETAEQIMEIVCPEKMIACDASPEKVIHSIHEFLMEHLSDRITIDDLSKQFLMNPTTLKKVFKEVYGASLAAHMKQHRMEKAAEMLINTDMSVSQIALDVGYESQSRFTCAFKDAYGMLPTAYRKKEKKVGKQSEAL